MDGDYDILNFPNRKYFVDNEILDYKNTADLNKINDYDWKLSKSIYKELSKLKYTMNKFVVNNNILIAIRINQAYTEEYDDDCDEIIGLFTPDYNIIISNIMGHPKIETNDFIYCNSDGSGPDIIDDINDAKQLSNHLIKYYHEFINDNYH